MNFKSLFFGIAFLALLFGNFSGFSQSISGFSPMFCSTNEFVQITGSGFTGVTNAIFFNNKSVRVVPTADNQINVVVPFGATTGPIQVKKGASIVTSVNDLTIIGKEPYVTSFSPISGSAGTLISLNGVHFTGVTNAKINGATAAITPITSDTQMKITAPANVTTGPISLTRSNLTFLTSSNYFAPAAITNFVPSKAVPGTTIVIKGRNFLGTTVVRFNGVTAPDFFIDSNSQITVTLPATATTGLININPPGGQANSSSNFVVLPLITGFSPSFGKPGTNVTITGLNLLGNTAVSFNGANASLVSQTSTQVVATVPTAATSGYITLTTTNGVATSATFFYVAPSIAGFSPGTGAAGTVVTLTGKNFTNATDVTFNGASANFSVVNNTTITATVPANAMSGPITVTTPGGTATTDQNFFVQPTVTGFTPDRGIAGTIVTINGTSFTNVTAVRFNGADAVFSIANNLQLIATVPTNATTGPISVVAPAGTAVSANSFTVETLALRIELLTNNIASISWPESAVSFSLERSTNLSFTNWVAVTNATFVTNGRTTLTNAATNNAVFYRLRK